jgi:hypothetical protein
VDELAVQPVSESWVSVAAAAGELTACPTIGPSPRKAAKAATTQAVSLALVRLVSLAGPRARRAKPSRRATSRPCLIMSFSTPSRRWPATLGRARSRSRQSLSKP